MTAENHAMSAAASPGNSGWLIPGAHEGYVSWEEFERIASGIRENTQGEHQPDAVKNGQALLT
jgi:hypothetical protein